jgi:hypothetical protein
MKKLIDTSALLEDLRRGVFEEGALSVITLIEVLRGVSEGKRESVKSLLEESYAILGIDNRVVLAYCELYSELRKRGELVPDEGSPLRALGEVRAEAGAAKLKGLEHARGRRRKDSSPLERPSLAHPPATLRGGRKGFAVELPPASARQA